MSGAHNGQPATGQPHERLNKLPTRSIKLLMTRLHEYTYSGIMKQKITLTIEDTLVEAIKIQAVRDKRSVSDITEELYREYLKQSKGKAKK